MRLGLELRSVSDMCRSSTSAAPRGIARDSPMLVETSVTGESAGTLILISPCEFSVPWARKPAAPTRQMSANRQWDLLHIHIIDRHVAGFRIHVASPHGALRSN